MADPNELIRKFTVGSGCGDFFIKGGKIYVVQRYTNTVTVYHYGGEQIKDLFSDTSMYGIDDKNGRLYTPHMTSGSDYIKIRRYDGSVIRNTVIGYVPRMITTKHGKYWITEMSLGVCHEHNYDGSQVRTINVGSEWVGLDIHYGRFYFTQGRSGMLRILHRGGDEVTTRSGTERFDAILIHGGRVYCTKFDTHELYIVNYAYFNIP